MPTRGPGISGLGVVVVTVGAYVMYASVRDVPLLEGARELLRGKVPTARAGSGDAQWIKNIADHPASAPAASIPGVDAAGADAGANAAAAGAGAAGGWVTGSAQGDQLVNAARRYLGRPYVWSGTFAGTGGGDCSGLVQRAFKDVGVTDCPRTSGQIAVWRKLRKVARTAVAPGDVLWWPGHVALATSNTQMIEAPTFGVPVRITGIRGAPLCLRYAGW